MVSFTRIVVALIATAAIGVEAGGVGSMIKKVTGLKVRGQGNIWQRDESLEHIRQEIPECFSAVTKGAKKLHVQKKGEDAFEVDNMPDVCMKAIKGHNDKDKNDHSSTITGKNSVLLKDMEDEVYNFFQGLAAKSG